MIAEHPDFRVVNAAYPLFGSNIQRMWGTRDFIIYIKDLLASPHGTAGKGFPEEVHQALTRLSAQHDQEYHHLLPHMDNNEDFKSVAQAFPAIGEKLNIYWGLKEFGPYMASLLHDNRGKNRKGFPFDTLMALHALAELHNKDFGHLYPDVDIWSQS